MQNEERIKPSIETGRILDPNDKLHVKEITEEHKTIRDFKSTSNGLLKILKTASTGFAVIAAKNIKAGTTICNYRGKIQWITEKEFLKTAKEIQYYAFEIEHTQDTVKLIFGHEVASEASLINCSYDGYENIKFSQVNSLLAAIATRDIMAGEEILVNYGNQYYGSENFHHIFPVGSRTIEDFLQANNKHYEQKSIELTGREQKLLHTEATHVLIPKAYSKNKKSWKKIAINKINLLPVIELSGSKGSWQPLKDQQFITPLMYACLKNNQKMINILKKGDNVCFVTHKGCSAWSIITANLEQSNEINKHCHSIAQQINKIHVKNSWLETYPKYIEDNLKHNTPERIKSIIALTKKNKATISIEKNTQTDSKSSNQKPKILQNNIHLPEEAETKSFAAPKFLPEKLSSVPTESGKIETQSESSGIPLETLPQAKSFMHSVEPQEIQDSTPEVQPLPEMSTGIFPLSSSLESPDYNLLLSSVPPLENFGLPMPPLPTEWLWLLQPTLPIQSFSCASVPVAPLQSQQYSEASVIQHSLPKFDVPLVAKNNSIDTDFPALEVLRSIDDCFKDATSEDFQTLLKNSIFNKLGARTRTKNNQLPRLELNSNRYKNWGMNRVIEMLESITPVRVNSHYLNVSEPNPRHFLKIKTTEVLIKFQAYFLKNGWRAEDFNIKGVNNPFSYTQNRHAAMGEAELLFSDFLKNDLSSSPYALENLETKNIFSTTLPTYDRFFTYCSKNSSENELHQPKKKIKLTSSNLSDQKNQSMQPSTLFWQQPAHRFKPEEMTLFLKQAICKNKNEQS